MKRILLIAIVLLNAVLFAAAAETEQPKEQEKKKELGISFEEQYHSQWLSKGVQAYRKQGAFFEILDVDFYGSGFGLQVIHRHATQGYVNKQRFDYRPYVRGRLFKEKPYEMKYDIGVEYEHYPRLATHKSYTSYEWQFGFSWPNILPKGFVPGYIAHYEYPVHHNFRLNYAGWVHRFKLDYYMDVPQLLPKPLCLSSEVAYTDKLGGASSDWSYAVFGLGTKFDLTKNLTFGPAVYHQITMDKSVARQKSITYCILSMKYKF
jgi:opacity protein-like surface antigen